MGPNCIYTYVGRIVFALLILTSPLPSLAWKLCNNYPTEVAEFILPTDTSRAAGIGTWTPRAERLQPRRPYSNDDVVTWCNISTKTFVAITPQNLLPLNAVNNTLNVAKGQITVELNNPGTIRESYIVSPIVKNAGRVTLTIVGLDTGSLTWLMSYDAVLELLDWMSSTQTWAGVKFEIWYGIRRVGGGTLQQGARTAPPAGHG